MHEQKRSGWSMRRLLVLIVLLASSVLSAAAEPETFKHVKIHRRRSDHDRVLVDKVGTLTFDDANRKFTFEKPAEDKFDTREHVEVPYDSVTKILFERRLICAAELWRWQ
jgi:hypothetical protein